MPSIQRNIRKSLSKIIQNEDATTGERLEACKLLLKINAATTKGKPRGRAFSKKVDSAAGKPRNDISSILERIQ
jgi:hypothetical protein